MALLTEALAGNVSNVAQKKAFLNSPDTKLKENIRKRHEKVSDTKIKIKLCRRSANFGLNYHKSNNLVSYSTYAMSYSRLAFCENIYNGSGLAHTWS